MAVICFCGGGAPHLGEWAARLTFEALRASGRKVAFLDATGATEPANRPEGQGGISPGPALPGRSMIGALRHLVEEQSLVVLDLSLAQKQILALAYGFSDLVLVPLDFENCADPELAETLDLLDILAANRRCSPKHAVFLSGRGVSSQAHVQIGGLLMLRGIVSLPVSLPWTDERFDRHATCVRDVQEADPVHAFVDGVMAQLPDPRHGEWQADPTRRQG